MRLKDTSTSKNIVSLSFINKLFKENKGDTLHYFRDPTKVNALPGHLQANVG